MIKVLEKAQIMILNNRLNYVMAFFAALLVLFYVYFANTAVRTVTTLQNTKAESQDKRMEVTELETRYLSLESKINIDTATHLGLQERERPIFLVKRDSGKTLSLR